jgi:hypothetical protein
MAKLDDTIAERRMLLTLARRHGAVAFPFPMLKDVDAYVEMEEPIPFADGPKRVFLLDVKAVGKPTALDFEIGPVYTSGTGYTDRHGLPLNELVRAEGWGLSGAEDVAAFVMADGQHPAR